MTPASPTPIPGISPAARAAINATAREIIVAAVMAGRRVDRLCLVVDGADVRLEPRADVVAHYRACGVTRLAKALERLQVPRDQVAVLVVADDVGLMVVALSTLGIDPAARRSAAHAAPPLTSVAPAPPRTATRPAKNTKPATRRAEAKADIRRTTCATKPGPIPRWVRPAEPIYVPGRPDLRNRLTAPRGST